MAGELQDPDDAPTEDELFDGAPEKALTSRPAHPRSELESEPEPESESESDDIASEARDTEEDPGRKPFTRRRILGVGGASLVGAAAIAWFRRDPIVRWWFTRTTNEVAITGVAAGADVCVLTPEQIEGPYYLSAPLRSDIREDRVGLDLVLDIELVSWPECEPLTDATVEIWHCDAEGNYSGYEEGVGHKAFDTVWTLLRADSDHLDPVNDNTYLRGAQTSDADGRVSFRTIFPGWYDPRVTHIHLKVSVGGRAFSTTQLYFPDPVVDRIYRDDDRYSPFGECPYDLTTDFVIGDLDDGTGLLIDPVESVEGLQAAVRIGVTST